VKCHSEKSGGRKLPSLFGRSRGPAGGLEGGTPPLLGASVREGEVLRRPRERDLFLGVLLIKAYLRDGGKGGKFWVEMQEGRRRAFIS